MHKPRIIFFDIDGTLIDTEKKRITERTLDALRRLQQNSILLAIATERSYHPIRDYIESTAWSSTSFLPTTAPTATTVAEIFLSAPSRRRMCRR